MADLVKGNMVIENAAVAWVMELERRAGRTPVDTRHVAKAPGDIESPPRTIEVKAFGKSCRGTELWLETAQVDAAKKDADFHVYIVANVSQGDPEKFVVKVLAGDQLLRLLGNAKERRYYNVPLPVREYDSAPSLLPDGAGHAAALPVQVRSEAVLASPPPAHRRLDAAAQELGSPPSVVNLTQLTAKVRELYSDVVDKSLSTTIGFHTINIRSRAQVAGDFTSRGNWNNVPVFLCVGRGLYRRLSEDERAAFRHLWDSGEALLRTPSYTPQEWDNLFRARYQL